MAFSGCARKPRFAPSYSLGIGRTYDGPSPAVKLGRPAKAPETELSAVPVVARRTPGRAARVARGGHAGRDRDVAAGDIAAGGVAGQLLGRARIAVVQAGGGASAGRIAGLAGADAPV